MAFSTTAVASKAFCTLGNNGRQLLAEVCDPFCLYCANPQQWICMHTHAVYMIDILAAIFTLFPCLTVGVGNVSVKCIMHSQRQEGR